MTSRWSAAGQSVGRAALTLALLAAASGCTTEAEPASRTAPATASGPAPGTPPAEPDTAPAPPDPAPAPPDPAPAPPDPAPAPPDPEPAPSFPAAATRTPSATDLACDAVEEELTDAVIRYEVQALAEQGPGGGDRAAAGADMTAAMDRARAEAGAVPGLAAAAAPAMAEVVALRDGMAVREVLDEEDAEAWRDARDRLEAWCEEQG